MGLTGGQEESSEIVIDTDPRMTNKDRMAKTSAMQLMTASMANREARHWCFSQPPRRVFFLRTTPIHATQPLGRGVRGFREMNTHHEGDVRGVRFPGMVMIRLTDGEPQAIRLARSSASSSTSSPTPSRTGLVGHGLVG